jgi:LytS/YehU family sensor histidine kinase
MQMRIPDRLQYTVDAEPEVLGLACPATALLTLVENAVRHGIDPAEDGGRIDVRVSAFGGRCRAQVLDTGVGLSATSQPGGTGLANLRERLALVFGPDASLRVLPQAPRGTRAEIEFPARAVPA